MKNPGSKISLVVIVLGVLLFEGCSKKDDPVAKVCTTTSATIFDVTSTNYTYQEDTPGNYLLHQIDVYAGTDSAYTYFYTYTSGKVDGYSKFQNGQSSGVYVATYAGDKISKFTLASGGLNKEEVRLVYTGDNMTELQEFSANAAGTLFEVGHVAFTYNAGNMVQSDTYVDLAALFSLAFGTDPTGYSPIRFVSNLYTFSDSPNPLKGSFFVENPDWSVMAKMPATITSKDLNNTVIFSDTYTITKDGNGNVTHGQAGLKYVTSTFVCK